MQLLLLPEGWLVSLPQFAAAAISPQPLVPVSLLVLVVLASPFLAVLLVGSAVVEVLVVLVKQPLEVQLPAPYPTAQTLAGQLQEHQYPT